MRILFICILFFSVGAGIQKLHAEEPPILMLPGDARITGAQMQPYVNAWRFTRTEPDNNISLSGQWTDQLTIKGSILIRRQNLPSPQGRLTLINRTRTKDMSPIDFEILNQKGGTLQKVSFEGETIEVGMFGSKEPLRKTLPMSVFDGYLYGILFAALPLQENFSARIPVLSPNSEQVFRTIRVLGRESVTTSVGHAEACWRVTTDDGLSFWIGDEAPYILRAEKHWENGRVDRWEMEDPAGYSRYLELRTYQTKPGKREAFLEHFETHYLESQESHDMRIWGQFRDLNKPDQFIWLRGYRQYETRPKALMDFYTGKLWAETGSTVRELMAAPATHVYFLEPASPKMGFWDGFDRQEKKSNMGIVGALVFLAKDGVKPLVSYLEKSLLAHSTEFSAKNLGLFVSSEKPNNFPLLPFIEDTPAVVWFGSFPNVEAFKNLEEQLHLSPRPAEVLVLQPGRRSRLFHRQN